MIERKLQVCCIVVYTIDKYRKHISDCQVQYICNLNIHSVKHANCAWKVSIGFK